VTPTAPAVDCNHQEFAGHNGGGCALATVGDYVRFEQMLLNGGEFDSKRIPGCLCPEFLSEQPLRGAEAHRSRRATMRIAPCLCRHSCG
jgi:hypothetical protein